jgi:hypothetical protein
VANDFDIGRLAQAMQNARLVLRTPRQNRFDMVRQYVGRRWSEEGSIQTVPCNLLSAYVGIVGRKLIAHNPRVMLSTWNRSARPVVTAMETWANQEIERIKLQNTLQRIVVDALFSVGICKVALATPADAAISGWRSSAGQPVAERVDLDDLVFDVHARDFSECGFIGHRFRAPMSVIRKSKIYSRDRKNLEVEPDRIYNMEGDERIGLLGRTTLGGDQEEYEDFVDLWEVYLPRHKVVLTLRDDNLLGASGGDSGPDRNYGKALRIQKWLGPDSGPYHFLGFGVVPGNPMPKAPLQDLYDLHLSINAILRKIIRQSERQKQVTFIQGGAAEDGSRLMELNDGEIGRIDNPEKIKQVDVGGPNQQLYMIFEAMKTLFSWLAGNLDVMGGLSPQGDTATQEKLLNANSSGTLSEMQQRTVEFSADVVKSLTWYWHHHPQTVMKSEYHAPGLHGMSVTRSIHPPGRGIGPRGKKRLSRDHNFDDMDIKVDPYSMQAQTPQQRLQMMQQLVMQVYQPMAQIAQQQGISLDLNAFFEKWGKYADFPDIQELLTVQEPPEQKGSSGPSDDAGSGKPPETTRNYTRRSMGAQGPQNQVLQMLQAGAGQKNGQTSNGMVK